MCELALASGQVRVHPLGHGQSGPGNAFTNTNCSS